MNTPSGSFNLGYFFRRSNSPLCNIDINRPAVKYLEKSYTYKELNHRINKLANGLLNLGIGKGSKVGILMFNSTVFFESFYAAAKIGAVMVPINFRLIPKELEYIINNSEMEALVYSEDFQQTIDGIRSNTKNVKHYIYVNEDTPKGAISYTGILDRQSDAEPSISWEVGQNDMVMIMYTSGTTGTPKGVMFTHSELLWSAASQAINYGFTKSDVTLLTGPLYHVGALVDLSIGTTNMGGTNVIMPSKDLDVSKLLDTIQREHVTNLLLFPIMVIRILNLPNIAAYDLSSLRFAIVGGERIDPHLLQQFHEKWPWVKLYQAYGLTEGSEFTSILESEYVISKAGSIGKEFFNVEIRLVDDNGKDVPRGEIGEIINRSPATRGGYWKNKEATADTFGNGWCYTGDLGKIDEDGFLWIAGRKKDMIRSAGENIYASEVEAAIMKHPNVLEVAVYPVPHPEWTECVMASVVLKENCIMDKDELIEFCKQHIAPYKKPKYVEFIDALPRNASNKVLKYVLKKKNATIAEK